MFKVFRGRCSRVNYRGQRKLSNHRTCLPSPLCLRAPPHMHIFTYIGTYPHPQPATISQSDLTHIMLVSVSLFLSLVAYLSLPPTSLPVSFLCFSAACCSLPVSCSFLLSPPPPPITVSLFLYLSLSFVHFPLIFFFPLALSLLFFPLRLLKLSVFCLSQVVSLFSILTYSNKTGEGQ